MFVTVLCRETKLLCTAHRSVQRRPTSTPKASGRVSLDLRFWGRPGSRDGFSDFRWRRSHRYRKLERMLDVMGRGGRSLRRRRNTKRTSDTTGQRNNNQQSVCVWFAWSFCCAGWSRPTFVQIFDDGGHVAIEKFNECWTRPARKTKRTRETEIHTDTHTL